VGVIVGAGGASSRAGRARSVLPTQTVAVIQRGDVDDPPQAAVLARLLRLWGVVDGLGLALITLARLAPPPVGILVTVAVLVVAAVVYVRIVHPVARRRPWGLMSFLPVALRLRFLGCVVPAVVVWLWLFVGDYAEVTGRPGGLVLAAVVIAAGTVVGAWWASSGLDRR
jgi:hypothetical protein